MRLVNVFLLLTLQIVFGQDDDSDATLGYSAPRSKKAPQLTVLDATCDASGMQVTVQFDSVFNGIIYSKGSYYTNGCSFVQPNTNQNRYSFNIPINACGTQSGNDDTKTPPVRYIENTIIMQNDAMYQQQTDVARKVRCNWNTNFRNTITFSPFKVDMTGIVAVNFNGNDVTTAMSVQVGRGPFAPVIAEGIVQVGDTLTLVIYLQTKDTTLELKVLDCTAMDGKNRNSIKLTDENGCVLKEKLIQPWMTTRETQNTAAEISYAYLTAFKFPDDFTVNIKCNIAVCKGGCPTKQCMGVNYGAVPPAPRVTDENARLYRKTTPVPEDKGYGVPVRQLTPKPTTTTTTTPRRTYPPPAAPKSRVVSNYGIEEVDQPDYGFVLSTLPPLLTRPAVTPRRKFTVFDRKRRAVGEEDAVMMPGNIPLVSSIRVISPADMASSNSSIARLSLDSNSINTSTVCINIALFAFGIALIFALLIASFVTSGLLCVRQRSISKKERELYDTYDAPLPHYPQSR